MKILFVLSAMLILCWCYGRVISSFVSQDRNPPRGMLLQIGYAYFLVFSYAFFFLLHTADRAVIFTLFVPVLFFALLQLRNWIRRPAPEIPTVRRDSVGPLIAGGLFLAIFTIWPYLLCGWGNYWQSGNRDIEDALTGRDAYLNGQVFDSQTRHGELVSDRAWYDFAKVTKATLRAESYREWYAGDFFRFQYSSQAFWSAVFQERNGIDIAVEQEMLNLILMFTGIYYLCRRTFLMPAATSALAACSSILNALYFATFFAGHIGSLMFGSLAPALLYLGLPNPTGKPRLRATAAYFLLILLAIGYSYAHPLAILAPALIVYWLGTNEGFRRLVRKGRAFLAGDALRYAAVSLIVMAVVAVALVALWDITAGYRLRQASEYRAWGFTHDWIVLPLFLGLLPSPMGGVRFAGAELSVPSYLALVGVAAALVIVLVICYYRFRPAANPSFFRVFGACWIALFLVFRFFIVDSYYLYKFLYTVQFVLVIGIVAFLVATRSRMLKVLGAALLVANIVSDVRMARAVYLQPYNHEAGDFAALRRIDPAILRKSFIDISGGEGVAARQILKANGTETGRDPRDADYFIVPAEHESDIAGAQLSVTVARAGTRLVIKRAPAHNYLMIRTWNEPEWSYSDPALRGDVFRWMGSGNNDNLGVYVIRPDSLDSPGRYLRMCFVAGPSASGAIPVTVSAAAQTVLARVSLDGLRCVWIPKETALRAPQPLVVRSGAKGKSMLPRDDRILLYRVFDVGWTADTYDSRIMSIFNMDHDITPPAVPHQVPLLLGQGWQPVEHYDGQQFRWAGASPEIILPPGRTNGSTNVEVDLEPGPSYGTQPFRLTVDDSLGNAVFQSPPLPLHRQTLRFSLKYTAGAQSVYVLRCASRHVTLSKDPRELDFRVFHITSGGYEDKGL